MTDDTIALEANKEAITSNLGKMICFSIFTSSAGCTIPTVVVFWQSTGMNLLEGNLLQALFAICVVAFEVPSGYIADIFGRKKTLVYAAFFYALGYVFYSQGHGFWSFALAEVILAFAISLISGADCALVYDTLLSLGREQEFSKYWGEIKLFQMVSMAAGSIGGAFIASFGLRYPYIIAVTGEVIAFVFALQMIEPPRIQVQPQSFREHVREVWDVFRLCLVNNHEIRWSCALGGATFASLQVGLWLYQPYYEVIGVKLHYFGLIFALYHLAAGFSARHAALLERRLGLEGSTWLIILAVATSYGLMGSVGAVWGFFIPLLHQFARGATMTIYPNYLNQRVESRIRATAVSVQTLSWRVVYAVFLLPAGYFAKTVGPMDTCKVLAILTLITGAAVLGLKPKATS